MRKERYEASGWFDRKEFYALCGQEIGWLCDGGLFGP